MRCRHPGGEGRGRARAQSISIYTPHSQISENKRSLSHPAQRKPVLTTEQLTKLYDNYINTAIGTWDDILIRLQEDEDFSRKVEEGNYIEVTLEVFAP